MKKNLTLFFVLVASLFLIFSCSLISADAASTVKSIVTEIKNVTAVLPEEFVIQIFVFIIVSLFVYSVFSLLNLFGTATSPGNRGILIILSFAIGGLSTYFMSTDYFNLIKQFYTAFGGTLIAIIPFFILCVFAYAAIRDGNVQLLVMQHIAWGIFFIFLSYTLLVNWYSSPLNVKYFFVLMAALALILAVFNRSFIARLNATLLSARANVFAQKMDDVEKGITALGKVGRNMGGYQ